MRKVGEIDLGAEHLLTEDNIYSKLVTKLYGYEVWLGLIA